MTDMSNESGLRKAKRPAASAARWNNAPVNVYNLFVRRTSSALEYFGIEEDLR